MFSELQKLCAIAGVSGNEGDVRSYIVQQIAPHCEYTIDPLGNVIAYKKGKQQGSKKIMLCAHMDEVGFIITGVTDDGYLRFDAVGGIDPRVVFGTRVLVASSQVSGVIGAKAVHHLSADEKKQAPKLTAMLIDIGATSKEQALEHISLGDFAFWQSDYYEFGDRQIKARALDDRVGCAILLDLIKQPLDYDAHFVFNTQEEVGLRGARVSSFTVGADYAIVLEATTAADLSGVKGEKRVCVLGEGTAISFMDRSTVYDKQLYKRAFAVAQQAGIKCQAKTAVAGGNDSGVIHLSKGGVRTIALNVPCRYIHSPSCVVNKDDIIQTQKLLVNLFNDLSSDEK